MHKQSKLILAIICLFLHFQTICQSTRPNIILIIADDMGVDITPGFQENETMPITPNLDLLRQNGLIFSNAWSAPQCTPTRASMMSGKFGIKTGVMKPPGNLDLIHESIFTKLKENTNNAYSSAVIGKWHISSPINFDHPAQHNIDHFEGFFPADVGDYFNWEKITNGESLQVKEYATSHFTDAAIDWIGEQKKPWFLWLAHAAPHAPFHVPPSDLFSIQNTDGDLGKYIAAIEAMDHEIGRLLQSLDPETRSNTTVIFIGDNGTPGRVIQNFPSDHGKATLFEGGIRVPLIVSGDQVKRKGEEENVLAHAADIYATILELAGASLPGGIHNSFSLKPLLSCEDDLNRGYNYTDYIEEGVLGWAIRNEQYKLIQFENGDELLFDLLDDIRESNNLINIMTPEQEMVKNELAGEAISIRDGWSCNDGIQNGEEPSIDGCEDNCTIDNSTSTINIGCCEEPDEPSVYYEFIEGNQRNIYTNDFPNHSYCYNPNQIPEESYHHFKVDLEPQLHEEITYVVRPNGRPARFFGVAKNGVIMAPAPAQPFIFEDANTGEFNWDWVFEPTNNQGNGPDLVALDCSSAHTSPNGYHYHGNMFEYLETILPGSTTASESPEESIHIGWAADGFPVLYRFGPNGIGGLSELTPSYQLKKGLRPGEGITEPCGIYNGKYTVDYEYICGKGDLDECNGIARSISVNTANGLQTFGYFYVITANFPQIPRCLMGNVSSDFDNGNGPIDGIDNDNDGFINEFDCDDNDPNIHPNAEEIQGNEIDENCDGITTSTSDYYADHAFTIFPNPSSAQFTISSEYQHEINIELYGMNGKLIQHKTGSATISIENVPPGIYLLQIKDHKGSFPISKKVVVQ